MSETNQEQMVDEFCKVTGTNASRAKFYLEAAGWDTNLAMSSYFEQAEEDVEDMSSEAPMLDDAKQTMPTSATSRIATFSNMNKEKSDDDDDERQAFFVGGSKRSGQQVLGPGKRKTDNQVVEELFKAVRSQGAEVVGPPERSGGAKLKAFCGPGHVLGSTPECSNVVGAAATPNSPVEVSLQLWKTGFTVDGSSVREYQDPENKEFLDSIRRGEIPMELRRQAKAGLVHINIEDHSHEDPVPQKLKVAAFSGAGFRLGSITPNVSVPQSTEPSQENEARSNLNLDESLPVTSIQIRLADGSRLTMRANHTHTVGDVRSYIVQARPEYSASVFSLMMAYPSKELTNENASLIDENLLNAVIVQKLK